MGESRSPYRVPSSVSRARQAQPRYINPARPEGETPRGLLPASRPIAAAPRIFRLGKTCARAKARPFYVRSPSTVSPAEQRAKVGEPRSEEGLFSKASDPLLGVSRSSTPPALSLEK
ncbi:hypothetical protein KM043_001638 [Ampulex compressa]|nr:hypothetical protein KM043_001638 [Ampulex compressa]